MLGVIRGGLKRIVLLGGGALLAIALFHDSIAHAFRNDPIFQQSGQMMREGRQLFTPPAMYFAPDQNLEPLDIEHLRQTHSRLDVSMYSFTDRQLARVLKDVAQHGSVIRLYRDKEQFESERTHSRRGHPSTTDLLKGIANVHIRVKGGAARDLMHQKDYCVDCSQNAGLLREGSANWSLGAEKYQDNSIWFTSDRRQIALYEHKFEEMWARSSNLIVQ